MLDLKIQKDWFQVQDHITMVNRTIGIKEHIISYLQTYDFLCLTNSLYSYSINIKWIENSTTLILNPIHFTPIQYPIDSRKIGTYVHLKTRIIFSRICIFLMGINLLKISIIKKIIPNQILHLFHRRLIKILHKKHFRSFIIPTMKVEWNGKIKFRILIQILYSNLTRINLMTMKNLIKEAILT